jgi:cleavage and polyadenylation specificity factor subunit 3
LAADGPEDEAGPREKMTIIPLGGGQEVGRSCIVVQYRGKTIMLDCGLHTQRVGHEALPLLDYFELETVDLLLVTHFHMDHVACLPYLTEKTMFAGRIFMTRPTKAVARLLLQDFVRKNQGQGGAPLYDEADVDACLAKCEVIDTHQTVEHRGIRFRAYTAGHVLGACMFMLEIGGVNVLYTGDYSMEEDRHLMGAEIPSINPDVLIVESTFGIAEHGSREEREQRFTAAVEDIVSKQHGACLIPVFALGRAQELLLLLDEFWRANHHLQSVPVYYANGLSNKALRVYRTYINMMNDHIRSRQLEEPFRFKHISMIQQKDMGKVLPQEGGRQQPCVVLATPGTLEGGLSRSLLEQWCDGKKNGVVLTGFLPEGTIAKDLTRAAADRKLQLRNGGGEKAVSCRVDEMSFAAHVDFAANYDFISRVRPANVVLVHGESRTMDMLKTELVRRTMQWEPANERPSIHNPANVTFEVNPYTNTEMMRGQVNLRFARQKKAKVGRGRSTTNQSKIIEKFNNNNKHTRIIRFSFLLLPPPPPPPPPPPALIRWWVGSRTRWRTARSGWGTRCRRRCS